MTEFKLDLHNSEHTTLGSLGLRYAFRDSVKV